MLEKAILIILLLVFLISCNFLVFEKIIKRKIVPDYGGTYIEAVIANSEENLEPVISQLTNASLIRVGDNGDIQPQAAEKWEISEDGLAYKFFLKSPFKAQEFLDVIQSEEERENWQGAEIKVVDDKTLEFDLKSPLGTFLSLMNRPVFPYGPYRFEKKEKGELIFRANKDFYLGRPYINTVKIKIYPNREELKKKFAQDKNDGFVNGASNGMNLSEDFTSYLFPLPRYEALFFNLKRETVKDKQLRKNLKDNVSLGKEINLNLVTGQAENNLKTANDLKDKWEKLGAKINIVAYSSAKLQSDIIPKRDFDILLYGLDYGLEPDYFSFWHSSQIDAPGTNLSGFADAKADKILEDLRTQTDNQKRKEKTEEFKKILDEQTPLILLDQITANYHINKKIKGVKIHALDNLADRFSEINTWYIREKRVK